MEKLSGTIVMADDEMIYRKMLRKIVEGMGFEVVAEATNGQEAVGLYSEFKPDLLFLDINMPVKSGEDALKEIMEEFPEAFIIMLTGQREMEVIEDCFSLGAANYIPKDHPIPEIKKTILETWKRFKEED